MDAGNLLKPMLARGELRAIGATTLDEYRKHIEKDAALERRFQPVLVGEPWWRTRSRSCAASRSATRCTTACGSGRRAGGRRRLSDRYIADRFLPDKAIDLVDEAASRLRIEIDSMPNGDRRRAAPHRAAGDRAGSAGEGDGRAAVERREAIAADLANLHEQLDGMKAEWQAEKEAIERVRNLKALIEETHSEAERAQRESDLQASRGADLRRPARLERELERRWRGSRSCRPPRRC